MHKFKLKGYIDSEFGYNTDQLQMELAKAKGEDLFIDIDSVGGCLHTGITLFAELRRYAKENNAHITTRSSGFVASIATAPFLAGDERIVNEFMQPFVHEPLFEWTDAKNAQEFRKEAEDLEKAKDTLSNLYAQNTTMSKEKALELMANDTWLTAEECLKYGFATQIEKLSRNNAQLVASVKQKLIKNERKMSKQKASWFTRLANLRTAKAELSLADVSGNPIVFPQLESDATPAVGDAGTVDGDANFSGTAETEEYILTFEEGVLTDVIDKADVDTEEIVEELLDIIEEKDAEIERLTNSLEKQKRLSNVIAGKDPKNVRNGKEDGQVVDKVAAAKNRINNRKKK